MKLTSSISILLLILLTTLRMDAVAQRPDRMIPISFSLYGDLELEKPLRWEPGFFIDLTVPVASNARKSPKTYRQLSFKPSLGFYNRRDYHTGVLFWTQLGMKTIRPSGFFWELHGGPGYLHTFYNAPVYVQNDDGTFSQKKLVGEPNLMAGGELGIGWDLAWSAGVPVAVFMSGGMYGQFPYNEQWARHKFIKIGFSYVLKGGK